MSISSSGIISCSGLWCFHRVISTQSSSC